MIFRHTLFKTAPAIAIGSLIGLLSGCNLSPTIDDSPAPHTSAPATTEGASNEGFSQVESVIDVDDQVSVDLDTNERLTPAVDISPVADGDDNTLIVYVPGDQPTPPKADLWERLRQGYAINHPRNAEIERFITRNTRYPKHALRISERAQPYLYYIVEQLDKRNMPMELALLPVVESRFDVFAYSPGRASGLWQFIPGTGRRFKLDQNWWYDGRRDVVAATDAALNYLEYLYGFFDDDWLLALAAYNAGEGTVARAIRRNKAKGKPTDYWSLPLPKETRLYVPKLLAWADIIGQPERYDIDLVSIADRPHFKAVDIGSQIDLAEAAKLADIDIKTLYRLNPAYNRWATDPKAPHTLLVPIENAATLTKALTQIPINKRVTWQRYTIKSGDSLGIIAQRFGTQVSVLKTANQLKNNRIRAGRTLIIPSASMPADYYSHSASQRLSQKQNKARGRGNSRTTYRVKAGDSLWLIAKRYSVNVKALARWNGIAPRDTLKLGQTLVIWTKATKNKSAAAQAKDTTRKLHYSVRQGDSLGHIAHKFSVRVNDIVRWNNIDSKRHLQPGQRLRLYVDVTQTSTSKTPVL